MAAPSGPVLKAPSSAEQRQIALKGIVPVKITTPDMVFGDFVSIGRVLPGEKDRFIVYVQDTSAFVQNGVLRLATSRFPPFTASEVKAAESDTIKLEKSLNSYLRNMAKSDATSAVWYERPGTKMRLAVQIRFPGDVQKQPAKDPQGF